MIDVVLLAGRLLLLALLYLFLFAAFALASALSPVSASRASGAWTLKVVQGPRELLKASPCRSPARS